MRKLLPWLLRLIGPALLLLFLVRSDFGQLYTILISANIWPILLSLLLLPPFLIIKSWRWRQLVRAMAMDLPLATAVGLYMVGIFLGATTPGQAGDLIKAWYLRDRGYPIAPALLSVVLDRLFDLLVMAAVATLGIVALGSYLPNQALRTALVVAIGLGLAVLTVVLVARGPRQWVLTTLLPRVLPAKMKQALERWSNELSTLAMHPQLMVQVGVASLISAGFTFFRLWLLFIALHISIPLYVVVGVSALIAVLQVLPISISGLGVRDTALIAVMAPYGYTTEQALSVAALFLLINIEHIIVGFIVSYWFPLGGVKGTGE